MAKFQARMVDECGDEFGAEVIADTRDAAFEKLRDNYPESSVLAVLTPSEAQAEESARYARLMAEIDGHIDWDDYGDDDDDDDEY